MTAESRMREALEGLIAAAECAHSEYRYVRLVGTHHKEPSEIERKLSAQIKLARKALSPPARIPVINPDREYEWVGRDEIRYRVSTTFGVLSLSYYHEWKGRFEGIDIDDADNVRAELAAAIATLAGLTQPEEES